MLTKGNVLVNDVQQDGDYVKFEPRTRSELAVPIMIGDNVFGVINLEHANPNAFSEEDEKAIVALASQAALAIDNLQAYRKLENSFNELRRHKAFVGSQTTQTWIRMILEGLNHKVGGVIWRALIGYRLCHKALKENDRERALSELEKIKNLILEIDDIPMEEPLGPDGVVESVPINHLLVEYLESLSKNPEYSLVELYMDIEDESHTTVRASKAWLQELWKILVDNAVQAMADQDFPEKRLVVRSHARDANINILFKDTGPGIPEHIQSALFKERIQKKKGESGMGIGLILAKAIVEAYEGEIELIESLTTGTIIAITLPVENNC